MTIKLLKRDLKAIEESVSAAQEQIREGYHTGFRCWLVYGVLGHGWSITHSKGNRQPGPGALTFCEVTVDDIEMYTLGSLVEMPDRADTIWSWMAALKVRLASE